MKANKNTFVRYAAVFLRWARGDNAHRLTSTVAGLLPDMIADAVRQLARWTLPLPETPTDVMKYLFRDFGLPTYVESYFAALARLATAIETHETAGSETQLEAELVKVGIINGTVVVDAGSSFWVEADNVTPGLQYGDPIVYGGGYIYGEQVDLDVAKNLRAMMRYFRPARERFNGLLVST